MVENGSPWDPIGRTFKYKFNLPDFSDMTKPKPQKIYQNPIYTALQWGAMLDKGQFKSKAELGRHFGVSRVRVVQMLNLLKLDQQVINQLKEAGESFNKRLLGEKTLRQLINFSSDKQVDKIKEILQNVNCKLK